MTTLPASTGPHQVDINVGRKLAERRLALGYNQSQLARSVGLTFQQIQKYEKASNRVSASKLWEMAQFLDVDVAFFFENLGGERPVEATGRPTPEVREVSKLAASLPPKAQRLVLELVRQLAATEKQPGA